MTDINWVDERYQVAKELLESTVELWLIGDPLGHSFDLTFRRLRSNVKDQTEIFASLVDAAKALRWRLLTDPQPWVCDDGYVRAAAAGVIDEANRLAGAVSIDTQSMIDDLVRAAHLVTQENPAVGPILLEAINEVGASACIVVVANGSAARIGHWLQPLGISVVTLRELIHYPHSVDQVYVVGPPFIFPSALMTAPVSSSVAFQFPEWFGDRTLPVSPLAKYTQGTFQAQVRLFPVNTAQAETRTDEPAQEHDMAPAPLWPVHANPDRAPRSLEVTARRAYLSGGYFVFLDDGERIRTIDPTQAVEDRVGSLPISAVQPGTYLLLRLGESEQGTLYRAALNSFGPKSQTIAASQARWKAALSDQITLRGAAVCERELRALGVVSAARISAWIDPTVDRPQRSSDFKLLLQWLGDDAQSTFTLASELRSRRQQLGQTVRLELEQMLLASDLKSLVVSGHLELSAADPKYRGLIATRVLAISPWQEIVAIQQVRVLFEDSEGGGRWLE